MTVSDDRGGQERAEQVAEHAGRGEVESEEKCCASDRRIDL